MNIDEWLNLVLRVEGVAALCGALVWEALTIRDLLKERRQELLPFLEIRGEGKTSDMPSYEFDTAIRDEVLGMGPILDRTDHHIRLLNNYSTLRNRVNIPKGVVIVGPPGVGKTLLSRYIFTNVGGVVLELQREKQFWGFQNIRNLYEAARKKRDKTKQPVVLFRDEIGRGSGIMRGEGLDLLEELTGINSRRNDGIFFVATTNEQLEELRFVIDEYGLQSKRSPLYRPGRLEIIEISPPTLEAKARIFGLYLKKSGAKYNGNTMDIASMIPYFQTGAFIESVVNETFSKTENISDEDLLRTITSMLLGNKQEAMLNKGQRVEVAKHELGHYFVAKTLGYEVAFVSVDCHSNSLGYAHLCPHESDIVTKEQDLVNRMKIFMGGYVVEMIESEGRISTACLKDIESIHQIHRFLYALQNRGRDPVYLFHGHGDRNKIPDLKMPEEQLKKLEDEVNGMLKPYKDKIASLAEYVASKGIVHSSELAEKVAA